MVNINGDLLSDTASNISVSNRGYKFGDALFETLKVVNGNILFWEDHYFRLMASMRILRMEIPALFTLEFLENEVLKTLDANNLATSVARVRINIDRGRGGTYMPLDSNINFTVTSESLLSEKYSFNNPSSYCVDLFKDYLINTGLLSTLKTNNKITHVLASIYASDYDLDNCLLLNANKTVVEATNGNLFLIKDNEIKTPPLNEGCLKGIIRKQIIKIISSLPGYTIKEATIHPYELQKADELFITNIIIGIQPIGIYRKKKFTFSKAQLILQELNKLVSISYS